MPDHDERPERQVVITLEYRTRLAGIQIFDELSEALQQHGTAGFELRSISVYDHKMGDDDGEDD